MIEPRLRPWSVVFSSGIALGLRAWLVQAGGSPDSSLRHYLSDARALWSRGSALILLIGAAAALLPARRDGRRLERLGWAWALWSTLVACVPPRPANFWANGGVDDEALLYSPLAALAVSLAWVLASPMTWQRAGNALAILLATGACLLLVQGGHEASAVALRAAALAVAAALLPHLSAWGRTAAPKTTQRPAPGGPAQ